MEYMAACGALEKPVISLLCSVGSDCVHLVTAEMAKVADKQWCEQLSDLSSVCLAMRSDVKALVASGDVASVRARKLGVRKQLTMMQSVSGVTAVRTAGWPSAVVEVGGFHDTALCEAVASVGSEDSGFDQDFCDGSAEPQQ